MSEFKGILLNRERIDDCINGYFGENVKINKQIQQNGYNYTMISDKVEYKLNFYFNKDGKTTISYKTGKFDNYEKNRELAVYISKNAVYNENSQANINYSTNKLDNDTFGLILDFLKEEVGCEISEQQQTDYQICYKIKFIELDDTFTINKYTTGKVHFQGRPLKIYSDLYPMLCEFIDKDDIVKINEELHQVHIKKSELFEELEYKLPLSYNQLSETIKKILLGSLVFRKMSVDLEDYTPFVFSSLRALEGCIKLKLVLNGIRFDGKDNFHGIFEENKSRNTYELCTQVEEQINCQDTKNLLEEYYSYYAKHRHSLFHTNSVVETSRLIDTKEEVNRIIDTVFELIEKGYN